mgnify:CR=1 FL=1
MLKYKNKKLIFRIILLVLMDMLIITAAGPLAIYVRYNLFFEPQAIEFIERIGSGKYYCGMSGVCSDPDGRYDFDGTSLPEKLSFYVLCCSDSRNFHVSIYLSDSCLFPTEAAGADQGRQDQYHDRRRRRGWQYIAEGAAEQ